MAAENSGATRRKKRIVGMVAIALLLLFTALAVIGFISVLEWIIADLIVAVLANLILKSIGRERK
jgi:hypothetical protein